MLRQTITVMKKLRELNRSLDNNQKINEWVDDFLDRNMLEGKSITIISPWSLSKSFEKRFIEQGNRFIATNSEISLFQKDIPRIFSIFEENGFSVEWWISFSRSYLDERAISVDLEKSYMNMIKSVANEANSNIAFINWEDDVILKRHAPAVELLDKNKFTELVSNESFMIELGRWSKWAKESGITISDEELGEQTRYQVACEAEEGRFLMEEESPITSSGNFLFLPLGRPEKYSYFSLLSSEFEKRCVFVLPRYPWRLKNIS